MLPVQRTSNRSGSVIIEVALAVPLLLLILLGVSDFGRVFYDAVAVQQAARAGVQYGSIKSPDFTDTAGMRQAALDELGSSAGVTVTADRYCTCNFTSRNDCSTACTGRRMYVEVVVTKQFTTIAPYPGLPSQVPVTATAILRVK